MTYSKHIGNTPQTEKADPRQIKNDAGGYTFKADDWTRLNRFLILGNEGGSYYANERRMTIDNYAVVQRCLKKNGPKTVQAIVDVSKSGRAVKNDPAIFAMAVALKQGDLETRRMASKTAHLVVRTGTHLFQFCEAVSSLGGWGKLTKRTFANWYNKKDAQRLAYQLIKYQQRGGIGHKDVLKVAHPKPETEQHNALYNWAINGWESVGEEPHDDEALRQVWAFERAKNADKRETIKLIQDYRLPHEAIMTQFKNDPDVQEALLQEMPVFAMLRNLANYTKSGLFTNTSDAAKLAVEKLSNEEVLKKAKLHPMKVLIALRAYTQARDRRGNTWAPVTKIVDVLDEAFYKCFDNVEATGKNLLVAVDSSDSMSNARAMGVENLSVVEAAAAMALIYAHIEDNVQFVSFDTQTRPESVFSKRARLDHVTSHFRMMGGGTDCASPIQWAVNRKEAYDAIVMLTDAQTWAGGWYNSGHVHQALNNYRRVKNQNFRFVGAAMQANRLTLTLPDDLLSFETAGLDGNLPTLVNGFISGEF